MSTVYITEQNTVVHQSAQHLVVTKGKERIKHLPLVQIDSLLVFGNVQITTQAFKLLLKEGIEVSCFTRNCRLWGRFMPMRSKNVLLRVAQYERYHNENFKVRLARAFVRGKLRNARSMILRYRRNYPEQTFEAELKTLDDSIKKLSEQKSVNGVMGLEGIGTATYFKAFGQMFKKELVFEKRTRRPPKDPVNAVLSLGYTMLTNEIYSLLDGAGFDPYIGFLHEIDYGRASLALDLIEEFRQPLVDRFTLFLFNNEILTDKDFSAVEGEGIYLTNEAIKTFFQKYEHRMREPFTSKRHDEKQTTFRDLVRNQVQKLTRTIKFNEPYHPFHLRD